MECLRLGVVPSSVAGLAQPAHVKWPAVVGMRGLDAPRGVAALLTDARASQNAVLDGSHNLLTRSICNAVAFEVGGSPRGAASICDDTERRVCGVESSKPLPCGCPSAVAALSVEFVSTVILPPRAEQATAFGARRGGLPRLRCAMPLPEEAPCSGRLPASACTQARARLLWHLGVSYTDSLMSGAACLQHVRAFYCTRFRLRRAERQCGIFRRSARRFRRGIAVERG